MILEASDDRSGDRTLSESCCETSSFAGRATSATATAVTTTVTTTVTTAIATEATAVTTTATTTTVATTATATTTTATVTTFAAHWLLVSLLLEPVGVLGVVRLNGEGLGPEIWGKISVGVREGDISGLQEVFSGSRVTRGLSIAILDTSEGEHLLGDGGADNTGTTGSGNELDTDGGALSSDLAWDGMDVTDLVTPITATNWHELELGVDESALNSDLHFLADLDAETNVASHVTDGDNSLEAGSLTSLGLLLDGDDLHDIVLELVLGALDELVNNTSLLDGNGVSVDLLEALDVVALYETAELGLGEPFVLGGATTATWAATATTAAEASAAFAATVSTTATAFTASFTAAFTASC